MSGTASGREGDGEKADEDRDSLLEADEGLKDMTLCLIDDLLFPILNYCLVQCH